MRTRLIFSGTRIRQFEEENEINAKNYINELIEKTKLLTTDLTETELNEIRKRCIWLYVRINDCGYAVNRKIVNGKKVPFSITKVQTNNNNHGV